MMTPEYKKYIEEISKKLDRLNQANGINTSDQSFQKRSQIGMTDVNRGDGFNDDVLNIMGSSAMNWINKNNKF